MYDFEEYKNKMRDFYFSIDKLPGPIVENEKKLVEEIKSVNNKYKYKEKYNQFNKTFNPHKKACSLDVLNEFIEI